MRLSGKVKALPSPELTVVPPIINIGSMKMGNTINRDIELINSGELDLSINEILNSPNCRTELVLSENEKIEIPEGGSRPMSLTIPPKEKKILKVICKLDVPKGQFSGRVTIKSNAKRIPVYVISTTGFIE